MRNSSKLVVVLFEIGRKSEKQELHEAFALAEEFVLRSTLLTLKAIGGFVVIAFAIAEATRMLSGLR